MPTVQDMRITRGLEISEHGRIAENEDGSFWVPLQTTKNVYRVFSRPRRMGLRVP